MRPENHQYELAQAPILNVSRGHIAFPAGLSVLRRGRYHKITGAVAGDAPKDFLRIYEYGHANKSRPSRWPAYIAKVGQKYYPNESITEHLLTRIGQALGINVAESKLMWVRGQLRFLSRYFLRKGQSLTHGAEIFAGALANDKNFVVEVEAQDESRNIFTFQVVEEAMRTQFPDEQNEILEDFVKMLAFDAIVGNNDRHFFNWGVIRDVAGKKRVRFSPVYDTARALFWNSTEDALQKVEGEKRIDAFVGKYVASSRPKTGWDGIEEPDHFQLIRAIFTERHKYRDLLLELARSDVSKALAPMMSFEFARLLTPRRAKFVLHCVRERHARFAKACA